MPIIKSGSKKAFKQNIEAEMESGKPKAQSLAIAYDVQRKNKRKKKMAEGGKVPEQKQLDIEPASDEEAGKQLDIEPVSDEELKMIKRKKYAFGGAAEDDSEPVMPARKQDNERPMESEYMADHFKDGGEVEDHYASIADAILAKKRKKMADGGEVDLSENAMEEPNNEDDLSFEALKKENYSESEGLEALDQPEDSNEHGHSIDEDEHDMVSSIRKKMKAKRGY